MTIPSIRRPVEAQAARHGRPDRRREQPYDEVVRDAWLMARTLRAADGTALDLLDEAHPQRPLAHLYQLLVSLDAKGSPG